MGSFKLNLSYIGDIDQVEKLMYHQGAERHSNTQDVNVKITRAPLPNCE